MVIRSVARATAVLVNLYFFSLLDFSLRRSFHKDDADQRRLAMGPLPLDEAALPDSGGEPQLGSQLYRQLQEGLTRPKTWVQALLCAFQEKAEAVKSQKQSPGCEHWIMTVRRVAPRSSALNIRMGFFQRMFGGGGDEADDLEDGV